MLYQVFYKFDSLVIFTYSMNIVILLFLFSSANSFADHIYVCCYIVFFLRSYINNYVICYSRNQIPLVSIFWRHCKGTGRLPSFQFVKFLTAVHLQDCGLFVASSAIRVKVQLHSSLHLHHVPSLLFLELSLCKYWAQLISVLIPTLCLSQSVAEGLLRQDTRLYYFLFSWALSFIHFVLIFKCSPINISLERKNNLTQVITENIITNIDTKCLKFFIFVIL